MKHTHKKRPKRADFPSNEQGLLVFAKSLDKWCEGQEKELQEIERDSWLTMVEDDIVTKPDDANILICNLEGKTEVYINIKEILGSRAIPVEKEGGSEMVRIVDRPVKIE